MAIGRTNAGGAGGAALNFTVVGGSTQPSSPKENMIWVNTDTDITSWIFSAAEPESPAVGMVWISVGTSSTVEFNALKKNGIQVYPLSAKQYVSGAWVDVEAMSYQDGEWVKWVRYLFNYSKQEYSWSATNMPYIIAANQAGSTPSITKNSDGSVTLSLNHVSGYLMTGGAYIIDEEIDLTDASTLSFLLSDVSGSMYCSVIPSGADAWGIDHDWGGDSVAYGGSNSSFDGDQNFDLDVSALSGSYKVCVALITSSDVTYGAGTLKQVGMR